MADEETATADEERAKSSIADAASNGHMPEDDDEAELFPLGSLEGDAVTPQKLIKRGLPVTTRASISKAEVPIAGGGLLDPNKQGRALVSYVYSKTEEIPEWGGENDNEIVGWKVRQNLRAFNVTPANDEVALIKSEFAALCALDLERGGTLLDELKDQL